MVHLVDNHWNASKAILSRTWKSRNLGHGLSTEGSKLSHSTKNFLFLESLCKSSSAWGMCNLVVTALSERDDYSSRQFGLGNTCKDASFLSQNLLSCQWAHSRGVPPKPLQPVCHLFEPALCLQSGFCCCFYKKRNSKPEFQVKTTWCNVPLLRWQLTLDELLGHTWVIVTIYW